MGYFEGMFKKSTERQKAYLLIISDIGDAVCFFLDKDGEPRSFVAGSGDEVIGDSIRKMFPHCIINLEKRKGWRLLPQALVYLAPSSVSQCWGCFIEWYNVKKPSLARGYARGALAHAKWPMIYKLLRRRGDGGIEVHPKCDNEFLCDKHKRTKGKPKA